MNHRPVGQGASAPRPRAGPFAHPAASAPSRRQYRKSYRWLQQPAIVREGFLAIAKADQTISFAAPGDQTWIRVGDRPTELKPGWCLRIGQRILVYQKATPAQ